MEYQCSAPFVYTPEPNVYTSPYDYRNQDGGGSCTVSVDKLIDRVNAFNTGFSTKAYENAKMCCRAVQLPQWPPSGTSSRLYPTQDRTNDMVPIHQKYWNDVNVYEDVLTKRASDAAFRADPQMVLTPGATFIPDEKYKSQPYNYFQDLPSEAQQLFQKPKYASTPSTLYPKNISSRVTPIPNRSIPSVKNQQVDRKHFRPSSLSVTPPPSLPSLPPSPPVLLRSNSTARSDEKISSQKGSKKNKNERTLAIVLSVIFGFVLVGLPVLLLLMMDETKKN